MHTVTLNSAFMTFAQVQKNCRTKKTTFTLSLGFLTNAAVFPSYLVILCKARKAILVASA